MYVKIVVVIVLRHKIGVSEVIQMVAIKDFGMPSCCVNCDMCLPCALDEGLCHITQHTIGDIYDKRPSDCPLAEIKAEDKLEKIEQIVKQVESLHPEVAIGDREVIRKIKEVLDKE